MCLCVGLGDRRDQSTLEKLQAERLGKMNELKEKTNYLTTLDIIRVRYHSSSQNCVSDSVEFLVILIMSLVLF